MSTLSHHTSHGFQIQVYRISEIAHPYPWRFKIRHGGRWWTYAGVPNYCETRLAAIQRARRKCKRMADESTTNG